MVEVLALKKERKIWGELYVDDDGEPHLDCHIHSSVTFQEALDVLTKWVELLQGTINRKHECPLHVQEKAGKDLGNGRTDV